MRTAARETGETKLASEAVHIVHPIPPVFDETSGILILGSFPSVRSRETRFYYGHPQNRFWKVLSALYEAPLPVSVEEKKAFLLSRHIALWDVIRSCDITGSSDASIRGVVPNDIGLILSAADIRTIYVNGGTAARYYRQYVQPATGRPAVCLPSTSPANARWDMGRLLAAWQCVRQA